MILTFILFFIIVLGLSFIADLILGKNKSDIYEQLFMRIGIGLALWTIVGIVMDLLFISLNIWIVTAISIVIPVYYVHKNKINVKKIKWKNYFHIKSFTQSMYYIIVLLMFVITAQMYIGGSLSYSYFENGDPWGYATVSKQIAESQTIKAEYNYHHYSEPYTQGYQIVMANLHQANDSIYLTLKIFHNLIISFSIIWFFFFARELFKSRKENLDIALFSTIALFAIPSWVSHFVFSLHYNMALLPVFFYALLKIDDDVKWKYVAGLLYGSILLNHFFTALVVTMMIFVYYFLKVLVDAKFNREILQVFFYGVVASLLFNIPTNIRHSDYFFTYIYESHGGLEMVLKPLVPIVSNILGLVVFIAVLAGIYYLFKTADKWFKPIGKQLAKTSVKLAILGLTYLIFIVTLFLPDRSLLFVKGSASRPYLWNDFFVATSANMINNPVGWGVVITLLVFAGLGFILYKHVKLLDKKNFDIFFSLNFFLFFLYLTLGMTHAVAFVPFRQWTFLALFVSLIVGYCIAQIVNMKQFYSRVIGLIIALILVVGMINTSFSAKYELNHDLQWSDYEIFVPTSFPLYDWIRENLPRESNVVNICKSSNFLVSYGMLPPIIDRDFNAEFRKDYDGNYNGLINDRFFNENMSNEYIHTFLTDKDIEYFTVGASCLGRRRDADVNDFQNKITRIVQDEQRFSIVQATESEILLKVN